MTPARRHSLIFPREHGAWGILLVPLVTGALAGLFSGGGAWPLAPLFIAVLSLFWLRTPVESWTGTVPTKARAPEEFALVRKTVFGLAALALAALAGLFWGGRNGMLLWIGAGAASAFLAQAAIRQVERNARMPAQIVGAAGLTAVAPAAYYVVTGHLNSAAWFLWAANLLFASNQIWFVQLRIRSAHAITRAQRMEAGRGFLAGQIVLILALAAAFADHLTLRYAAIAFGPILYRGFAWFLSDYRPLVIRALGKSELAHACAFGILLLFGVWAQP